MEAKSVPSMGLVAFSIPDDSDQAISSSAVKASMLAVAKSPVVEEVSYFPPVENHSTR